MEVSGMATNVISGLKDSSNNIYNAYQAQKQQDFQERMYKNAYRYKFEDIKKAGYNPIMALDAPPGAAPSGAAFPSHGSKGHEMLGSAIMAQRQGAEIKVLESQANLNNASAAERQSKEQLNYQEVQNRVDDLITAYEGRSLSHEKRLTQQELRQTEQEKRKLMQQQGLSEEDARLTGAIKRYVMLEEVQLIKPRIAELVTHIQLMKKQMISEEEKANLSSAEAILRDMDARLRNPEMELREKMGIVYPAIEKTMGLIGQLAPAAAILYGVSRFGGKSLYSPNTKPRKMRMGFGKD